MTTQDGDSNNEDLGDATESSSMDARREAADQQLVHALLQHVYEQNADGREARIQKAMQQIRESKSTDVVPADVAAASRRHRSVTARIVQGILAASILIAAVIWMNDVSTDSALAALEQAIEAIDEPVDRTYEITVEKIKNQPQRRDRRREWWDLGPPAWKPQPRKSGPQGPRRKPPGLNGAILHVRGSDQFVLVRPAHDGRVVVDGCNGRQSWTVRPNRPVLVSDDPDRFRIPMPRDLTPIPFVDIKSSLTQLREGYEIEELPSETPDDTDEVAWRRLHARKRDQSHKGPREIQLWLHPTTSVLGRVVFDHMHLRGGQALFDMKIELIEQTKLAVNWFDHQAHHELDQPIEHVDE